jgi:lysozyme
MTYKLQDNIPWKSDPNGEGQDTTSRRSILTGLSMMTLSGVAGLVGFSKYGVEEGSAGSHGATVTSPRQGPEYDMTEMLPLDDVEAQRLAQLGTIVVSKEGQDLREAIKSEYTDQVRACGRPFTPELHRELTKLVTTLNLLNTDSSLRNNQVIILPPLVTFVEPLNHYQELSQPHSPTWLARVSDELRQYSFLLARHDGLVLTSGLGSTYVAEANADWNNIIKAHYPELERYPKTRAHLISVIANGHLASSKHGPEEGRIIFLPALELFLQGGKDPKTLLECEPAKLLRRLPPGLTRAMALEGTVWNKFLASDEAPELASILRRGESESLTSPKNPSSSLQEPTLPSVPSQSRVEFRSPSDLAISSAGISLIKGYESFFAKPYYCCAKKLTVGYGCRIEEAIKLAQSQKGGLTKDDADRFLQKDIELHAKLVRKHFSDIPLTQGMFDAIVSWSFNTGALQSFNADPKKQPNLHKLLEDGDYKKGLKELLKWVYYKRNGEKHIAKGLVRRRASEYKLACKGLKESEIPQTRLAMRTRHTES